jgi:DNA recombination protein RmuC
MTEVLENANKSLFKKGYLDLEIDPSLDLVEEINKLNIDIELLRQNEKKLIEDSTRASAELESEKKNICQLKNDLLHEKTEKNAAENLVGDLRTEIANLKTRVEFELKSDNEKLSLLQDAQKVLSDQFKSVANDILEEKSKRFTEQNQLNIGQILDPLKERMTDFKSKVEEIHGNDIKNQAELRAELSQLKDLNKQITEEPLLKRVHSKGSVSTDIMIHS